MYRKLTAPYQSGYSSRYVRGVVEAGREVRQGEEQRAEADESHPDGRPAGLVRPTAVVADHQQHRQATEVGEDWHETHLRAAPAESGRTFGIRKQRPRKILMDIESQTPCNCSYILSLK